MDFFILAQEHAPEEGHGGAGINPLSPEHANYAASVWAFGIFVVLFLVLWKMAWGPITKGLQNREDKINESLKRAEELEKATRELAETNRIAMEKAQQEAQGVVAEARVAAKKAAADVIAKAQIDIEASRERFEREMRLEVEKVRDEIRKETVDITLAATAKMLGRSVTSSDHRRLAEEALHDAESVARN
ncbi:MAG: ATP synthase F0 subunit B [Planctomycetes bacterium]|nr:ATP synthase F0 subunit B [Planctomycetota bacterium]